MTDIDPDDQLAEPDETTDGQMVDEEAVGEDRLAMLIRLGQQEQTALIARLNELETRLRELEADGGVVAGVAAEDEVLALNYDTVDEFVDGFCRVRFETPELVSGAGATGWCHQWHRHPAAEYWFETLWRSFEEARVHDHLDGGGSHQMAWAEHYFRPVMLWFTSAEGPFKLCRHKHLDPSPIGSPEPSTGVV